MKYSEKLKEFIGKEGNLSWNDGFWMFVVNSSYKADGIDKITEVGEDYLEISNSYENGEHKRESVRYFSFNNIYFMVETKN